MCQAGPASQRALPALERQPVDPESLQTSSPPRPSSSPFSPTFTLEGPHPSGWKPGASGSAPFRRPPPFSSIVTAPPSWAHPLREVPLLPPNSFWGQAGRDGPWRSQGPRSWAPQPLPKNVGLEGWHLEVLCATLHQVAVTDDPWAEGACFGAGWGPSAAEGPTVERGAAGQGQRQPPCCTEMPCPRLNPPLGLAARPLMPLPHPVQQQDLGHHERDSREQRQQQWQRGLQGQFAMFHPWPGPRAPREAAGEDAAEDGSWRQMVLPGILPSPDRGGSSQSPRHVSPVQEERAGGGATQACARQPFNPAGKRSGKVIRYADTHLIPGPYKSLGIRHGFGLFFFFLEPHFFPNFIFPSTSRSRSLRGVGRRR